MLVFSPADAKRRLSKENGKQTYHWLPKVTQLGESDLPAADLPNGKSRDSFGLWRDLPFPSPEEGGQAEACRGGAWLAGVRFTCGWGEYSDNLQISMEPQNGLVPC